MFGFGLLKRLFEGEKKGNPDILMTFNDPELQVPYIPPEGIRELRPIVSLEIQAVLDDYEKNPDSWTIDISRYSSLSGIVYLKKGKAISICLYDVETDITRPIFRSRYDYPQTLSAHWSTPHQPGVTISDTEACLLLRIWRERHKVFKDNEYKAFQQSIITALETQNQVDIFTKSPEAAPPPEENHELFDRNIKLLT